MKTDAQVINFFRSVQYGKNLVKDVTPEMISSMDTETTDKVKRINLLFDMIKDAQKKLLVKLQTKTSNKTLKWTSGLSTEYHVFIPSKYEDMILQEFVKDSPSLDLFRIDKKGIYQIDEEYGLQQAASPRSDFGN